MNFFEQTGILKVILGKGSISAYELNYLKKGDAVLVTDRLCGEYAGLYFNNQQLGLGDIIISQGRIGFRIVDTGWTPDDLPFPGVAEKVVEILETEFVVCERTCSLEELKGIGKYSVIDFGPQEGQTRQVTLYAAGISAASGITIVSGENWGIQIENTDKLGKADLEIRTIQPLLSAGKVKYYDYTRPDRFSMDQLLTIKNLHERFIYNLQILNPKDNMRFYSFDQLTWGEWCRHNVKQNNCHQNFKIAGSTREMRGHFNSKKQIFFLPSDDQKNNGNNFSKTAEYKAHFKDNQSALPFQSILITFQGKKATALVSDSTKTISFLSQLESSWREKLIAEFSLKMESKQIPKDFLGEYEIVVLITVIFSDSDKNRIEFIYPYLYLQKILHLLG